MKKCACSDWPPKQERLASLSREGFPFLSNTFGHMINRFLSCLSFLCQHSSIFASLISCFVFHKKTKYQ